LYLAKYSSKFATKFRQKYRRLRARLYIHLYLSFHLDLDLYLNINLNLPLFGALPKQLFRALYQRLFETLFGLLLPALASDFYLLTFDFSRGLTLPPSLWADHSPAELWLRPCWALHIDKVPLPSEAASCGRSRAGFLPPQTCAYCW